MPTAPRKIARRREEEPAEYQLELQEVFKRLSPEQLMTIKLAIGLLMKIRDTWIITDGKLLGPE